MSERVYLDYNASAPIRPEAVEAMAAALRQAGNPSSVHGEGRRARALVETAREQVARLVGAMPENVVFTSGGTEANVTALAPGNACTGAMAGEGGICLVSAIEHPSVLAGGRFPAEALERLPVAPCGTLDLATLSARLAALRAQHAARPILVSVMAANNETGALQPVREIAERVHAHDGVLHVDAVQAAGKIALDIGRLGADLLSLSAHKIGGPQGIGALVLGLDGTALKRPLLNGGGQERRQRAGTENVAGIVGFGVAAELAARDLERFQGLARLRDAMEARLAERAPDLVVFARKAERLANTSCLAVPATRAETMVIGLDLAGVAVSAGSACSSGKVERSHVLEAMGAGPDLAAAAIRISLGWQTTQEDIERFIAAWSSMHGELTGRRAAA